MYIKTPHGSYNRLVWEWELQYSTQTDRVRAVVGASRDGSFKIDKSVHMHFLPPLIHQYDDVLTFTISFYC